MPTGFRPLDILLLILIFIYRCIRNIVDNAWIDFCEFAVPASKKAYKRVRELTAKGIVLIGTEAKKALRLSQEYIRKNYPVVKAAAKEACKTAKELSRKGLFAFWALLISGYRFICMAMEYTDAEFEETMRVISEAREKDRSFERVGKEAERSIEIVPRPENPELMDCFLYFLPAVAAMFGSAWFFHLTDKYINLDDTLHSISTEIIMTNKTLSFLSGIAAIGLAVYAIAETLVLAYRVYLVKRYGKAKIEAVSQPTRFFLAIYLAAVCFLTKDFIQESFELTNTSKLGYAASAALPFLAFIILLASVVKMVVLIDRMEVYDSQKT